jgi:hypothetical protein
MSIDLLSLLAWRIAHLEISFEKANTLVARAARRHRASPSDHVGHLARASPAFPNVDDYSRMACGEFSDSPRYAKDARLARGQFSFYAAARNICLRPDGSCARRDGACDGHEGAEPGIACAETLLELFRVLPAAAGRTQFTFNEPASHARRAARHCCFIGGADFRRIPLAESRPCSRDFCCGAGDVLALRARTQRPPNHTLARGSWHDAELGVSNRMAPRHASWPGLLHVSPACELEIE